jgi:uncharacterized protein YjbI with pentapeptide repeats
MAGAFRRGQHDRPEDLAVASSAQRSRLRVSDNITFGRRWRGMNFTDQRMDGSEFRNCSLVNAVFDDVNLSGARLTNVNLAGLVIEDADIKGLTIFGYDVGAMVMERLRQEGRLPG